MWDVMVLILEALSLKYIIWRPMDTMGMIRVCCIAAMVDPLFILNIQGNA
jgi:hypothetical protein